MLYLVGTPIGNLEDISARAIKTLRSANYIYAEDTRKTRALLSHLAIRGIPLRQYNENVHDRVVSKIIELLKDDKSVVVVTDAGMPAISDPGTALVSAVLAADLTVTVIPGPTAESCAVALSGVVDGPYLFTGFLTLKKSSLKKFVEAAYLARAALVGYVAPHDIAKLVASFSQLLGDDAIAVIVREITKIYEERISGSFATLATAVRVVEPKGEYVLVIPYESLKVDAMPGELLLEILNAANPKSGSRSERAKTIAALGGISKSIVYAALG